MIATLVCDWPWKFNDNLPGPTRGAAQNYKCMDPNHDFDFILPLLADDCRLFFWKVASMPIEAYTIIDGWGFTPKAELVWIKRTKTGLVHFGMGRTVRNSHETCVIATRGRPAVLSHSVRSVFDAPTGIHSEKPEAFYDIVEQLSPGPYAELFARKRRPGWLQFGDELPDNLPTQE